MPRVRVPVRTTRYRYRSQPNRYAARPPIIRPRPPAARGNAGLLGLIGGFGGLLLCLLCLATLGLLGLFATFIAVTSYLGGVYRALRSAGSNADGLYVNMGILLVALCFASFHKLFRSL